MRGKRAKKLRREVYGDMSLKGGRYSKLRSGQMIRDALRRQYQQSNKEWRNRVRKP